ncbi:hypothetical protein HNS01_10775 [Clostridium butyricum]|nr:hypothetical protein [Clostridium butyricum]NFB92673.1 hypothetical protein [Clostridium butyricum]UTY53551.1 hypothetical protein HNS01_10775 [Clostridium butyricum]
MRIMFTLNKNKSKENEIIEFLDNRTCNPKDFIKELIYQYISSYGIIKYEDIRSQKEIVVKDDYEEIKGLNNIDL